jgi:hypothetical protein
MTKITSLVIFTLLFVASCSSLNPRLDRPAVIAAANEQSLQLIRHAIANLLQGASVDLAEDALTQTSSLAVHRTLLTSRDLGVIDNFQLVLNRGDCYLVHLNTQNRQLLNEFDCRALNTE